MVKKQKIEAMAAKRQKTRRRIGLSYEEKGNNMSDTENETDLN